MFVLTTDMTCIIINYTNGKNNNVVLSEITAAIWHPREAGMLIIGSNSGQIYLYDQNKDTWIRKYQMAIG